MITCNDNQILVSILCLTYNHEKYISQALDGFISQKTSFPFEVIVHDDASTDGTVRIIKDYEKKYPYLIRAIYETNNLYSQGISCMRICLEEFCNGKYIALCEGDDYWTDPQKLETQISFMEQRPECTMTYHPVHYVSNGIIMENDVNGDKFKEITAEEIIHGGGLFCASPSLVFKRTVGVEYPKFRLMADIGDYPLQILTALRGSVFYFPKLMGCYRRNHEGSWSRLIEEKPDKAITHWNTEIAWLSELNKETNGKYYDDIIYRIACCQFNLYRLNSIQHTDLEKTINSLKSKKDIKELRSLLMRHEIKRRFPSIAKLYKSIKTILKL